MATGCKTSSGAPIVRGRPSRGLLCHWNGIGTGAACVLVVLGVTSLAALFRQKRLITHAGLFLAPETAWLSQEKCELGGLLSQRRLPD